MTESAPLSMRVRNKLRKLGSTPGAIAKSLRTLGIKGLQESQTRCPLAMYLNKTLIESPGQWWMVGGDIVQRVEGNDVQPFTRTPAACRQFIDRFDAGKYAYLQTPGSLDT